MAFDPDAAIAHLQRADPALTRIIAAVGPFAMEVGREPFRALALAILYQQLAGASARAIASRFVAIYTSSSHLAGNDRFPTPQEIIATPEQELRAVGLSRQKIAYLRDLALKFVSGEVDPEQFPELDDEEVIQRLLAIKGIGRWTAEMFLMFSLGRPDVLPVDDLGVRKAVQLTYGLPSLPRPDELRSIAEPWRPYRSVATWYLWQSRRLVIMETEPPVAPSSSAK